MSISTNFFRWLIFCSIGYLLFYWYIDTSHLWTPLGSGLSLFNPLILFFEIPLAVLVSSLFFLPSNRNPLLRYFLPLMPCLLSYVLLDVFYLYFFRSASLTDFANFTSVFEFSIRLAMGAVALFVCVLGSVLLNFYWVNKYRKSGSKKLGFKLRIIIAILFVWTLSSEAFIRLQSSVFRYTVWSAEDTIRENGKLSSFIYYSNQEQHYKNQLLHRDENKVGKSSIEETFLDKPIKKARNIYFIVLESFIDPRLILQLNLPDEVLATELKPFLNNSQSFSHVISPIYGGGTAQTEFELLTGIKALSKVNQIEFNVMKGGQIHAYVNALKVSGYQTMGTIAPSSSYFNSKLAYQSLGLDNIEYLEDEFEKMGKVEQLPIFDGNLFERNLEKVKVKLSANDKPLFSYALGMYGHMPFDRDLSSRPDRFKPTHPDQRLTRISNQFYYRTKALASYLKELIKLDSNSIIYVTSDHLPSILSPSINYQLSIKSNIALLIIDGKAVDVSGCYQYQMPSVIWSKLSGSNSSCTPIGKEVMGNWYFNALSQSIK